MAAALQRIANFSQIPIQLVTDMLRHNLQYSSPEAINKVKHDLQHSSSEADDKVNQSSLLTTLKLWTIKSSNIAFMKL